MGECTFRPIINGGGGVKEWKIGLEEMYLVEREKRNRKEGYR